MPPPRLGKSRFFPPADRADQEGLVLMGGQLTPEWLRDAYSHGIFPWPIARGLRNLRWFSPDPRAIFELDQFHASRRLLRTWRSGKFVVTCNRDFAGVITACAQVDDRPQHCWITPELIAAFTQLHAEGDAHSVEVWRDGELVGGVYGVAIGGLFAGESMFQRARDASKVALLCLVEHLRMSGFLLFDIQMLTPHTASLGATAIPRAEYLRRLAIAMSHLPVFGLDWERAASASRG